MLIAIIISISLSLISCGQVSSDSSLKKDYKVDAKIPAKPVENLALTIDSLGSDGYTSLDKVFSLLGLNADQLSKLVSSRSSKMAKYKCFEVEGLNSKNCLITNYSSTKGQIQNVEIEGVNRAINLEEMISLKVRLEKSPETVIEICAIDGISIGANSSFSLFSYFQQEFKGGKVTLKDRNGTKAVYGVFDIGSGGSYERMPYKCSRAFSSL